jgi:hypothetical protein
MIKYQQMTSAERFGFYVKIQYLRRWQVVGKNGQGAYHYFHPSCYQRNFDPFWDFMGSDPLRSTNGIVIDEVHAEALFMKWRKVVWDEDNVVVDDDDDVDPQPQQHDEPWIIPTPPNPPEILSVIKLHHQSDSNHYDKVPFIFKTLTDKNFQGYNLIHESFFYAIFQSGVIPQWENELYKGPPQISMNRDIDDPTPRFREPDSCYEASSRLISDPIVDAVEAKGMDLQTLLTKVHKAHYAVYRSQLGLINDDTTNATIHNKNKNSPNNKFDIRNYNHSIADVIC